jgi:hypothetical protein
MSCGVSEGDGGVVPDVGVNIDLERGVVKGVIWKFSWIGTERTRRCGRGVGDVDIVILFLFFGFVGNLGKMKRFL